MPKRNVIINSFNAGELSEKMDARIDQEKYAFGCRILENFIPLIYGGAERRPGTEFVLEQNDSSAKGRVVGFEHSVDDTYVLLFENQRLQFFTGGANPSPVFLPFGTEDLSAHTANIVAHWLCNDNLATQVVLDDDGATHNGTMAGATNTEDVSTADESGTTNKAFNLNNTDYFTVSDNADFTFGDGSTDSPFTFLAWVFYTSDGGDQTIIDKDKAANKEYEWTVELDDTMQIELYDDSSGGFVRVKTNDAIADGWHFLGVTYDGVQRPTAVSTGGQSGETAGIHMYVDFAEVGATLAFKSAGYVAMEDKASDVTVGANNIGGNLWVGKVNNVAMLDKELSQTEIAALTGSDSTSVVNIKTPYLTADIPTLKFETSADVIFITHPSYEERRLSRFSDSAWVLEVVDLKTGPFRNENDNVVKTIAASATTDSVTLTAVGHSPFVAGTTAGHLSSGSLATSKSQTGALFKLVHATGTPSIGESLNSTTVDDATTVLVVPKGVTWDFTTNGTWGTGGPSTIVLERSYDSFTTKETVVTVTSLANKNVTTSGTEDFADATYRARVTNGDGTGIASIQISVRDTSHVGIVEITAVASPQSATATILKTLGSTDPTHRFSEGSFSNFRGWPIDVTISAEERLTFVGSVSGPLTTWGSKVGDFTDYAGGTDNNDAITFTLVGTGQQNRIRWVIPKDALIIGTVGGAHLLGASKVDEALTPTNVRARLQTTKGSEDVAAIIINQAILFAERGGKKIRELLFDFDSDSYKADDLTVFAEHIMGTAKTDGVVDMAYQRTPDPVLWCVRNDGQIAVMSYERDQKVFAWSRFTTTDGTSESDFESVAVIYGGARSEDEVWVTVKRTVNSLTVRYVERFKPRNWGTDDEDAFFVDSGLTYDSTATSTVTAAHLKGETCSVFADGVVFDDAEADSGTGVITLKKDGVATTALVVQYGLGYTSTLKPMKLNIENQGRAATYHILEGVLSLFKTMRGEWGSTTSNLNPIVYRKAGETSAEFPLTTGDIEMDFEGENDRSGDVIVRQTDPVPTTVLALYLDVQVEPD